MMARPLNAGPDPADGLETLVASLNTVSLAECVSTGTRRFDRKFIVPMSAFGQLVRALEKPRHDGQGWRILEIEGHRTVQYHTVYFDTPDLQLYRDHLQGRRRRFKIRTRRYSTGAHMLEVKLKGIRGQTEKLRRERKHDDSGGRLDAAERLWLTEALQASFARPAPEPLHASAQTSYRRTCLVGPNGERLTIDRDFAVGSAEGAVAPAAGSELAALPTGRHTRGRLDLVNPGMAIIESKSPKPASGTERLLRRIVHRPDKLSKYAVALALTRNVRGNPWYPALRRLNAVPSAQGPVNDPAHA